MSQPENALLHAMSLIRDVPDFPQPGILFKDITPIFGDADALREVMLEGKSLLEVSWRIGILLAFAVAQSVQVVGVLLIFALLVAPAATAQRLTPRPATAIVLSVVLSVFGGMIGTLFGSGIALTISSLTPVPAAVEGWSVALGIGITALVGLFFGLYPASRAARLDPIEALRKE